MKDVTINQAYDLATVARELIWKLKGEAHDVDAIAWGIYHLPEFRKTVLDLFGMIFERIATEEVGAAGFEAVERTGKQRVVHDLRTHPEAFYAINQRRKTCEFRKDDRGFEVGHVLKLKHYDPVLDDESGMVAWRRVTHIVRGHDFGIPEGYVMMSLAVMTAADIREAEGREPSRRKVSTSRGEGEEKELLCSICDEWWPAACYQVDSSRTRGYRSACKACIKERAGGAG